MTIEDRLYLLHEMKECSRKNTEYLQNIPTDRHIQEPKSEHSFYDVSGSNQSNRDIIAQHLCMD